MDTILVVAAHPDDEVLGCGGTIARKSHEGHDIFVAILGEGITSRYDRRDQADKELLANLREKSRKAAEELWVKDLFLYDFPDNRFDSVPLLEIIKTVESVIQEIQPDVVFTHHGGDLNIDHVITFRSVLTATRPMAGSTVKQIYAFEVPSSTEWTFDNLSPQFKPNVFIDVSTTLETKIRAMGIYNSESRPFPHPRSREALRVIAKRWGSVVGCHAAEAFELIREIRWSPTGKSGLGE
jgi:LmbE family N-acetylglucosaminyl deacetylase